MVSICDDQTLAQLAQRFDVRPNQITQWKTGLLQRAAEVLATAAEKREHGPDIKTRPNTRAHFSTHRASAPGSRTAATRAKRDRVAIALLD